LRGGAAVGIALALLACDTGPGPSTDENEPVLAVERGTLTLPLLLTGELAADSATVLSAPRTETFELSIRWIAEDGSQVAKGDRLVEFDDAALLDSISERNIEVIQAGNELASLEARQAVELAEKRFAARQAGFEVSKAEIDAKVPEEILSRVKYNEYQLGLGRAQLARDSAKEDEKVADRGSALEEKVQELAYDKATRKYDAARDEIKSLTVTAPQDGVMIVPENPFEGRKLQVGDKVFPGFMVARIPDLSKMVVRAVLSDVDDGRVHPGMKAGCVLDAYPERVFAGLVRSVNPVAREPERNSTRRFFSVVIELDETDESIMRPGLSAKVLVEGLDESERLLVPREALAHEAEGSFAYDSSGERHPVKLGPCNARHCELLEALDEGLRLSVAPPTSSTTNEVPTP
jgi:multidrug resistance efflux pump